MAPRPGPTPLPTQTFLLIPETIAKVSRTIFRLAFIRSRAHLIPDLIEKVLVGHYPLEILGSGKQMRSYTYVDDVADAILYVTKRSENEDFNIGTRVETTVLELAEKIWKLCGRKEPLKITNVPSLKYDVQRRIPDTSKLMRLGWRPKVSLDEGLMKTIEWLRLERS